MIVGSYQTVMHSLIQKVRSRLLPACYVSFFIVATLANQAFSQNAPSQSAAQGLTPILNYISSAWDTLTRSMTECKTVVDPKVSTTPVLYLPAGFDVPPAIQKM